ncbi:MAG TPA: hypothetical protein VMR33_09645 [Candidatus Baltobacteraceae bacterium]|jgi:hypothetical protein|nr:hypothetical protein [Candidatus Baltobacteraceae bacterium]
MARNRKDDSALRLGPALTAVALCAFFVALGVGFVWYKEQIDTLGRQIKDREVRLADLQRQNKIRRDQLATLCSPQALDARVKKLNLALGPPAFSQVIRLVDYQDSAHSSDQRQAEVTGPGRKN